MKSTSQSVELIGCWRSSSLVLFRILMCAICLEVVAAWTPSGSRHSQLVSLYADSPEVGSLNRVLKKSETPQWDDLGWAWGKRSGGGVIVHDDVDTANRVQGMLPDLGWPWGKRATKAIIIQHPSIRSMGARTNGGLSANQLRALQSMVKKENPDWHDLGWAWGKRRR